MLILDSPTDGPLTPAFDKNEIGNALDWDIVWDTPMWFGYEPRQPWTAQGTGERQQREKRERTPSTYALGDG